MFCLGCLGFGFIPHDYMLFLRGAETPIGCLTHPTHVAEDLDINIGAGLP